MFLDHIEKPGFKPPLPRQHRLATTNLTTALNDITDGSTGSSDYTLEKYLDSLKILYYFDKNSIIYKTNNLIKTN